MEKVHFTDKDLDEIQQAPHVHRYTETIGSRRRSFQGEQIREFACIGCGFMRQVTITEQGTEQHFQNR